jgi:hypothetical protein
MGTQLAFPSTRNSLYMAELQERLELEHMCSYEVVHFWLLLNKESGTALSAS